MLHTVNIPVIAKRLGTPASPTNAEIAALMKHGIFIDEFQARQIVPQRIDAQIDAAVKSAAGQPVRA